MSLYDINTVPNIERPSKQDQSMFNAENHAYAGPISPNLIAGLTASLENIK